MIVIATERVQPLSAITYDLENKFDEFLISWGLHQVLVRLPFVSSFLSFCYLLSFATSERGQVPDRRLQPCTRLCGHPFGLCGPRGGMEALWV